MKPYYQDASVCIYHGDCREVLPTLLFDVVVSDPPYGMSYKHGARAGGIKYGMDGHSIIGDDEPFDPSHILNLAKPTILWGGNHFASRLPDSRGWLVWDKRGASPPNDQSDVELAWSNVLTTARKHTRYWSGAARGGREQAEGRLHTNQKPVDLMAWCLSFVPEGIVCDPYSGSGSTLVAAKEAGRRAIGIELEEKYCEIAARRCSQETLDLGAA